MKKHDMEELKEMQDAVKEANEFLGLVNDKNFNDAERDAENLLRRCIIKYNRWTENDYTLSRPISDLKAELFNTQWFAAKEIALMLVYFALEYDSSSPYWAAIKRKLQSF